MKDQNQFQAEANAFLDRLFQILKENKVDLGHDEIDHLCYRTNSLDHYQSICQQMTNFSQLLIESPVKGRMISTFKLSTPIEYHGRSIDLVEVPAPKPGKTTVEGFEHIEVVTSQSFSDLKNKYSYLKMDLGGLEKDFNQELEIEFQNCAVKFHHYSLEQVIELEKNQQIANVLGKSQVLKKLKPYSPLVSGTFPLGLGVENSDVDILISSENFQGSEDVLKSEFSKFENFQIQKTSVLGQETWIAGFQVDQVPFEIFWQKIPSHQQSAHRHLIVEARLLKMFGKDLKKKVLNLKKSGLKTEPAFAEALGIEGDPYEELLKLHAYSEAELWEHLNHTQLQI